MIRLTGEQKKKIEKAAGRAGWLSHRPSPPVNRPGKLAETRYHGSKKPTTDDGCWETNCWHTHWCIGWPKNGGPTVNLEVVQAWSAREARDTIYALAAKILGHYMNPKRKRRKGEMTPSELDLWVKNHYS